MSRRFSTKTYDRATAYTTDNVYNRTNSKIYFATFPSFIINCDKEAGCLY